MQAMAVWKRPCTDQLEDKTVQALAGYVNALRNYVLVLLTADSEFCLRWLAKTAQDDYQEQGEATHLTNACSGHAHAPKVLQKPGDMYVGCGLRAPC